MEITSLPAALSSFLVGAADELIVACVASIGTLLGTRYLERYRARQVFLAEVAKRQVEQVAAVWEIAMRTHRLMVIHYRRYVRAAYEQLVRADPAAAAAIRSDRMQESPAVLRAHLARELPFGDTQRLAAIRAEGNALADEMEAFSLAVATAHFWLDEALKDALAEYGGELTSQSDRLCPDGQALLEFYEHLPKLEELRTSVTHVRRLMR
jgi:hypothetical protein